MNFSLFRGSSGGSLGWIFRRIPKNTVNLLEELFLKKCRATSEEVYKVNVVDRTFKEIPNGRSLIAIGYTGGIPEGNL